MTGTDPTALQHALWLTFVFGLAAPLAHAWGCLRAGDFPRWPPLGVGLALASCLDAVLVLTYGGPPAVIGLAIPAILYLYYLAVQGRYPAPVNPLAVGTRIELPPGAGTALPAAIVCEPGLGVPFTLSHLSALDACADELAAAGVALVAVVPDSAPTAEAARALNGWKIRVVSDPDGSKWTNALGARFVPVEEDSFEVIPAFVYLDAGGVVRAADYGRHVCERAGIEDIFSALESSGVVFDEDEDRGAESAAQSS